MRARCVLALLLATAACRAGGPTAQNAPETPEPWIGGAEIASNDGDWRVVYKLADGPVKRGETFAIDAWVFASDAPGRPREDVSLAVDAAMPQHGHGMNRVPRVEKMEAGRFHVDGLDFHMPGKWELYFDVARGPLVERAQADVEVE
jgi:hypothetical protein